MPITVRTEDSGKTQIIEDMVPDRMCWHAPIFYVDKRMKQDADKLLVGMSVALVDVEYLIYWYTYDHLVDVVKTWHFVRTIKWRILRFLNRIGLADTPINCRMSWRDICWPWHCGLS